MERLYKCLEHMQNYFHPKISNAPLIVIPASWRSRESEIQQI